MVVFSGALFVMHGPPANPAVLRYRIGLLVIGVLGLGVMRWRRRSRRSAASRGLARGPETFRIPLPDPNLFMVRGFDFYVRLEPSRHAEMLEAVRGAVGANGTVYDQATHAVVLWHEFQTPEPLLERLSRELAVQVIWLAFQKQVDAFGYERWEAGTRVRRLVFGCYEERIWEQVDGEPEAWEAAAIFDEARLDRRLSQSRRLGRDFEYTSQEEQELQTIWRERRLVVGSPEPNINGRDVAEAVAIAYNLPGWD